MAKATKKATTAKKLTPKSKGGRSLEYTPAKIAAALRVTYGNLTETARQLKCTRQTVCNYLTRYPELRDVVTETRESMLDFAEGKLLEHIKNNSERSLHFYLQTQGRRRGYRTDSPGASEGAGAIQRVVIEVHKSDGGEG